MNYKTILMATTLSILPLQAYGETSPEVYFSSSEMNLAHRFEPNDQAREQKMNRLLQKLDLTTEQSQQIETIHQQAKSNLSDLRQQMQTQRQQIESLFASDADASEIRNQYQANKSLREEFGNNRLETMLQIREVLTLEQRAKLAELKQQRGRRFR